MTLKDQQRLLHDPDRRLTEADRAWLKVEVERAAAYLERLRKLLK